MLEKYQQDFLKHTRQLQRETRHLLDQDREQLPIHTDTRAGYLSYLLGPSVCIVYSVLTAIRHCGVSRSNQVEHGCLGGYM